MSPNRILIFDVDALAEPDLPGRLCAFGIAVTLCSDLGRTLMLIEAGDFDAALICLAPARAGLDLIERLGRTEMPVLVATPADAVRLAVCGLNRGALDYLIPPFEPAPMMARIALAHQRHTCQVNRPQPRQLSLDMEKGRLGNGSDWIWLTPSERKAIALLLEHRNRIVSKKQLKASLGDGADLSDSALGVTMHRLRAKLGALKINVRARRGEGYVLEESTTP